jgi:catechol 2,3-dioxygenase-like lactoylglutathione lyase family enzyme
MLTIPLAKLRIFARGGRSVRALITNIGQISVRVHDIERAVAFYRDVLGLDFLFDAGPLAFVQCADVRIMLTQPESDEFDHPSSTLYFRVDDITAARTALLERGVEFEDEPHLIARMPDHELWMTFFRDPDRNLHGLMAEVR